LEKIQNIEKLIEERVYIEEIENKIFSKFLKDLDNWNFRNLEFLRIIQLNNEDDIKLKIIEK
jgi:hypothetical protein